MVVMVRWLFGLLVFCGAVIGCPGAQTFRACDLVFEIPEAEASKHANPYLSVTLHAEFRSPRHRTFMMPGFWDGGRRLVIRFTPVDAGEWTYRVTSNVSAVNGKQGTFAAADSSDPGFLRPDNLFHWSYTEKRQPHLWMGDTFDSFATAERGDFEKGLAQRSGQKFNHLRGLVMDRKGFVSPDQPNTAHFQELDRRVRALNDAGLFVDLVLAGDKNHLRDVFPEFAQRERYVKYLAARYSAFKITWQGVQQFESYVDGRALLKEIGLALLKHDPYKHPRSTHTAATSAPLLGDGWMTHIVYSSRDSQLGAIERQLFQSPRVNVGLADTDASAFRRALWNSTMDGQYPSYGGAGADAAGAKAMADWFEFMSRTRFWELEPFFEVDGGRALHLTGVEYVVYIEKAGPVELVTEKKGYEVYWMNVATGEITKEKKDYKGERFQGQPPGPGEWVLHLSRDGRKNSMLNSYYFESRRPFVQDVESTAARVPFEMVAPASDEVKAGVPVAFAAKLKRETRATRQMMYLWTMEATAGGQGFRVAGTGAEGKFVAPKGLAKVFPTVLNLRLYGLNLNGKVYAIDRVLKLTE